MLKRAQSSLKKLALLLSAFLALPACSPSALFGSGADTSVLTQPNYRKVNTACNHLNLQSPELDASTLRSLLHCFNAYGALDQLEALTNQMSDAELDPVLKVGNRRLLGNQKVLFQTLASYTELSNSGKLGPILTQVGKLLENDEFVSAATKLLGEIYSADKAATLKALAKISDKANLDSVGGGLEFATNVANAPSFSSLQTHFRSDATSYTSTRDITDALSRYIREDIYDPAHLSIGKEFSRALISGQLFSSVDELTGSSNEALRTNLPGMVVGLESLFKNRGFVFNGVSSFFHYLNVPIKCFDGTQGLSNADEFILEEITREDYTKISSLIRKEKLLSLTVTNPFCQLPSALDKYYPVLEYLAATTAVEPTTQMTQSLVRNKMGNLLLKLLSDTGAYNNSGVKNLIPLLSEVADRGALTDAMLLMTSIKPSDDLDQLGSDRTAVKQVLSFILDESGGKSIYDTFTDNAAKVNPLTLYRFVSSASGYVDSKDALLLPSLQMIKSTLYMNDVHPFIGILHDVLQDAPQSPELFDSVFKLASLPEFQGTLKLLSTMAKDGRLKQITDSLATMYNHYAQSGAAPIRATDEPIYISKLRNHLTAGELGSFDLHPYPENYGACAQVRFDVPLDQYAGAGYDQELNSILGCINSDGKHADVTASVNFLRKNQTDIYNPELKANESIFDFSIDLVKKLKLTHAELKYVTDEFVQILGDTDFFKLVDFLPKLVTQNFQGAGDSTAGPVLEPLFKLALPVYQHREAFDRLAVTGSHLLQQTDLPRGMKLGEEIFDQIDNPESKAKLQPGVPASYTAYDRELLGQWIVSKECEYLPQDARYRADFIEQRTNEVIDDYENETTNFEVDTSKEDPFTHVHRPFLHWTKDRLRQYLNPMLDKLVDPESRYSGHSPLGALFKFLDRYRNDAAHPERLKQLQSFLQNRSDSIYLPKELETNRKRITTYMYPGEKWPRVKVVNTGDLFELVLVNANVNAPTISSKPPFITYPNSALDFMSQLALAWGDEKFEDWPKEVQKMFPRGSGKTPATLKQAVEAMYAATKTFEGEAGVSQTPGCPITDPRIPKDPEEKGGLPANLPPFLEAALKAVIHNLPVDSKAHLYNETQVLAVMNDNLPEAVSDPGIRIFRDIFYELYISTPEKYRNALGGDKNNLSLALMLANMGITHQALAALAQFRPGDETLYHVIETVSEAAADPATEKLVETLLENDPGHKIIWSLVDQVFSTVSSYELAVSDLDSEHQAEIPKDATPEQIRELRAKWAAESSRLKQGGFYIAASGSRENLVHPILPFAIDVVTQYRDYLAGKIGLLHDALTSENLLLLARAFYENEDLENKIHFRNLLLPILADSKNGLDAVELLKAVDENPSSHDSVSTFFHRLDQLNLSGYVFPQLRFKDPDTGQIEPGETITKALLHFIENEKSGVAQDSALRLRQYIGERMIVNPESASGQSDLDQYLALVGRDAASASQAYGILQTLSHYASNETPDLKEFFGLVCRTLAPNSECALQTRTSKR